MIETVLSGFIVALTMSLMTYFLGKKMIKNAIEDQKQELFAWIESKEGLTTIASIGKLIGAGLMTTFKGSNRGGNTNIMGFKIPNNVIDALIQQYLPKVIPKPESQDLLSIT